MASPETSEVTLSQLSKMVEELETVSYQLRSTWDTFCNDGSGQGVEPEAPCPADKLSAIATTVGNTTYRLGRLRDIISARV